MKILIVSDTHGRDTKLEEAVEKEKPFDMLIHCGDVEGREFFVEALAECPCCIVAGNNDFFSDLPREDEITIQGKKAMITHGHYYGVSMDVQMLAEEAKSRGCEIAMFGHTHKPMVANRDGVMVINPGSLAYPRQEGRKPSYAVMQTREDGDFLVTVEYLSR